jgi:hypothetical protein
VTDPTVTVGSVIVCVLAVNKTMEVSVAVRRLSAIVATDVPSRSTKIVEVEKSRHA